MEVAGLDKKCILHHVSTFLVYNDAVFMKINSYILTLCKSGAMSG